MPLSDFLASLGTAWEAGEIRPTHRREARVPHDWRTREDPFEHTWPKIQQWLETEPGITEKKLHERLTAMAPTMIPKFEKSLVSLGYRPETHSR